MDSTQVIRGLTPMRGVPLADIVAHFDLEVVTDAGVDMASSRVTTADLNRPGLQWAGYSEQFPSAQIQIVGRAEVGYLMTLPEPERWERLSQFARVGVPAAILTNDLPVTDASVGLADKFGIPLLRTPQATTEFAAQLTWFLALELAPREVLHAGLLDVAGEGVLILGRSGIGKSETALELIRRGHRLVADDTVEVRRPSDRDLVGRAPGLVRHFMEIKGIGIVNLRLMFGIGSVKAKSEISLVVSLVPLDPEHDYSLEPDRMQILGVDLPLVTIPVRPGRNSAVLIETAAMHQRAHRLLRPSRTDPRGPSSEVFGRLA
ncbi:MAG TPA: HPr(Ser) kinase/phosphatase [Candidatus Limnocylindrales bacterium]|nr:HPr(Ser) kinase/phosphatase [Candidatus Limnocylindrales bacterium]